MFDFRQTGSGKTYTMGTNFQGSFDDPNAGVIPRALNDIFKEIKYRQHDTTVTVTCSFLELYQEVLYDLLSGKPKNQSSCEIREDDSNRIFVTGLSEIPVKGNFAVFYLNFTSSYLLFISDQKEAGKCLIDGGENRAVGATAMNDESSRSHAIFIVNLKIKQENGVSVKSKFTLVDLAGSERSKKTKATGIRFKEGVKINKGLLALGNVISALGGGLKDIHVSYRDSKLTRLLQDSLGGNSVTLMIACVSPADYNIDETLSTLRYADRAKKIKNKPIKNQNSKDAEIAALKEKLTQLQMKLLDKQLNGEPEIPGVCGEPCRKFRQGKEAEIIHLRHQLSLLMKTINTWNDKNIVQESFFSETKENIKKLKEMLNNTCPAEFVMPDTKIFDDIKAIVDTVDTLIANYKKEIANSDDNANDDGENFDESNFDDDASKQKIVEFTNNQMKALMQIKNLEREMKIKQDLLERKNANVPFLHEDSESTINEYQGKIKTLEKELEEIRESQSNQSRRDHNVTKVNMDRKHKVEDLEKQLTELRKKCHQLEKTKKLADQDRKRVEDLTREINELKTTRVQLIKNQRRETEQYKKWERTKNLEIMYLMEKERKHKNDMVRLERVHERQQTVLKRKVEEAKAVNKRLQDAMDKSKKINSIRNTTTKTQSNDVVQNYLDHELELIFSSVDARIAMQSLITDRGLLNQRLGNLKSIVVKPEAINTEISQLEDDLALRKTQIDELRKKVMQTDLEAKVKSIPENFKTAGELKTALTYVIRAILESREDFTTTKTKAEDLKLAYETSEERIEQIQQQALKDKEEMIQIKEKLESDFEQKLSLFWNTLKNGDSLPTEIAGLKGQKFEEFNAMMQSFAETAEKKDKRIAELEAEVKLLTTKKPVSKRNSKPIQQDVVEATDSSSEEIFDDDEEFNFNDSFQDPDWVKTPHYRKKSRRTTAAALRDNIRSLNGTGLLNNISESSDTSSAAKNTSQGTWKCQCKGSCATKACGCKKVGNFCSETCRCSEACVNVPDKSDESAHSVESKENGTNSQESQESTPKRKNTMEMDA